MVSFLIDNSKKSSKLYTKWRISWQNGAHKVCILFSAIYTLNFT